MQNRMGQFEGLGSTGNIVLGALFGVGAYMVGRAAAKEEHSLYLATLWMASLGVGLEGVSFLAKGIMPSVVASQVRVTVP